MNSESNTSSQRAKIGRPEEQCMFLTAEPSLQPVLRIPEVAVVPWKSNSVPGKEQGLRTAARTGVVRELEASGLRSSGSRKDMSV